MVKAFERRYREVMKTITPRDYKLAQKMSQDFKMKISEVIMINMVSVRWSDMTRDEREDMVKAVELKYARRIKGNHQPDRYVPTEKYIQGL